MSLSLTLLHKDALIMSGDSRVSIKAGDEYYCLANEEYQKLKLIGNKVVFIGGRAEVAGKIIELFEQSSDQSIERLQQLTVQQSNECERKYGITQEGTTAHAMFLIGLIENELPTLYAINSKDDCKIIKTVGSNQMQECTVGPNDYIDQVNELYKVWISTNNRDLLGMYKHIYENVANEQIGGKVVVYIITTSGIQHHEIEIKDTKEIKKIESISPSFNSEKLEFTANGEKVLWFDIPNERFMFKGIVTASEIIGSHIRTNPENYPYCEISSTNNIFKAAKSDNSFIQIEANSNAYNSPIIYHVNGSVAAASGIQGTGYFIGVANGSLDLSTSNGDINMIAGTGYRVNINNLKPGTVDFYTSTVNGLLQSDVSGLVARLMAIEARLDALEE